MTLTIENLTKEFDGPEGTIVAVEDLSMDVDDGEFIVFVGPSGCGKTTTLRCIAGLETPTDGAIRVGGERVEHLPPQQRDIAMVFQNYALYPHLTVRENIGFGLKNRTDLSKEEINERVDEVAEMMGIKDLLEKKPDQLSGGQQQRVATGRAIVRDSEVFLFDEPLSNLDAKLRTHMRAEIQRIQAEFNTTSVYVTHDQEEAMTMADRMVVLKDGNLQQIGPPNEVYNNPANVFVASFIGEPSMNLIDASVEDGAVHADGFSYTLSDDMQSEFDGTNDVVLGIRPSDLEVTDADGLTSATVDIVERLGDENLLHLRFGDETYKAMVEPSFLPNRGDQVAITFDEADIHLFDRDSGGSIVTAGSHTSRQRATN